MNANSNKKYATFIALVMAIAASLFFLVAREITPLFLIAYAFVMFGIAGFWLGNLFLFDNMRDYPWFFAFPAAIWSYLILEAVFSAVFVVLEQTGAYRLLPAWFFLIHALIAAFFIVRLIMMKGGKEYIERKDA
jgi:hypothetical protein